MFTIKIDEDDALELLMDRVRVWTTDEEVINLYEQMYESYIYGGFFKGSEFEVMKIVDNNYVNYCSVLYADELSESDLNKIRNAIENNEMNVSCESFDWGSFSSIEAYNDDKTLFLIRN